MEDQKKKINEWKSHVCPLFLFVVPPTPATANNPSVINTTLNNTSGNQSENFNVKVKLNSSNPNWWRIFSGSQFNLSFQSNDLKVTRINKERFLGLTYLSTVKTQYVDAANTANMTTVKEVKYLFGFIPIGVREYNGNINTGGNYTSRRVKDTKRKRYFSPVRERHF